jgi:hypothetical protein
MPGGGAFAVSCRRANESALPQPKHRYLQQPSDEPRNVLALHPDTFAQLRFQDRVTTLLGVLSEHFRRGIIKVFLKKELISARLATSPINLRHSGFSVDSSIHLPAHSIEARKALAQYFSRPPLSLKKISVCKNGDATVISYTSDNEFFQGKTEPFSVSCFLLEMTQHIPPRGSLRY